MRTRPTVFFRRLLDVSEADCMDLALCRQFDDPFSSPTPSQQEAQDEAEEDDESAKNKKGKTSKEQEAREKAAKVSYPC